MNGKIGLRVLSALIWIAAVAGIAFFAYRAGVAQGSPVTIEAPSGEAVPLSYPYYGYGPRFHPAFGFGFGCFGLILTLLLFFLALKAFRFAVWGPRWGWGGRHGHWSRRWENGIPPMFDEWHKRAHGEQAEEKTE
jgi:hypothetical protein